MRLRYLLAGVAAGILIASVGLGKAHRLSGRPHTLQGKLQLAKAQVRHDRVSRDPWLGRDRRYVRQLQNLILPFPSWWLREALCVHRGEGSWSDSGAPFYGGMQFDRQTWLANGGGRFASYPHYASPREQLLVAYWTWRRRGWFPWPTTARNCGLL